MKKNKTGPFSEHPNPTYLEKSLDIPVHYNFHAHYKTPASPGPVLVEEQTLF